MEFFIFLGMFENCFLQKIQKLSFAIFLLFIHVGLSVWAPSKPIKPKTRTTPYCFAHWFQKHPVFHPPMPVGPTAPPYPLRCVALCASSSSRNWSHGFCERFNLYHWNLNRFLGASVDFGGRASWVMGRWRWWSSRPWPMWWLVDARGMLLHFSDWFWSFSCFDSSCKWSYFSMGTEKLCGKLAHSIEIWRTPSLI